MTILQVQFCGVEAESEEGGAETTVSKVVKKTTKTTVVSATEGHIQVFAVVIVTVFLLFVLFFSLHLSTIT